MNYQNMNHLHLLKGISQICKSGWNNFKELSYGTRYCQLDDVVTNTVGMLVGWGIWKLLSSVGMAKNPLF